MNQVLLTLGALTLGGSAAVLLLALMGRTAKSRYGAKWRCWAWLLLCLRLAVPVPLLPLFQVQAPIQVDLPNPSAAVRPKPVPDTSENTLPVTPPAGPQTGQNLPAAPGNPSAAPSEAIQPAPAETPAFSLRSALPPILLGVWLIGTAGVLLWNTWAHLRFLTYLHRWASPVTDEEVIQIFNQLGDQLNLHRRPQLLVCQGLKVPMLAGLLQPALLLPRGTMTGQELGLSLLHELTHCRRKDIWLKTLAMWVGTVHWFNPLMWHMMRLVERDTELACDEDALRRLPPELHSAYGQTILTAVARLQANAE